MKLSIIIPTFNSSKVIGRALDSIVAQTFGDWEVLVMDGASKDNTGEIVQSYNDNRIKFYSEPDKGIYDAMNKGIKKSQGEWLYFLGSDDWLYDDEVFSYFYRDNDFSEYDVVYGEVYSPKLNIEHKGAWSFSNLDFNRCHQAIFYKAYMFDILGLYNLKYKVKADHDYNLKWYLNKRTLSLHVNKLVSNFSTEGVSSNVKDLKFNKVLYKYILRRGKGMLPPNAVVLYMDKWAYKAKKDGKLLLFYLLLVNMYLYKKIFVVDDAM